jgi:hypothetical protein
MTARACPMLALLLIVPRLSVETFFPFAFAVTAP